jgi:hypothetical protein
MPRWITEGFCLRPGRHAEAPVPAGGVGGIGQIKEVLYRRDEVGAGLGSRSAGAGGGAGCGGGEADQECQKNGVAGGHGMGCPFYAVFFHLLFIRTQRPPAAGKHGNEGVCPGSV